jgi:hypothetical protein
MSIFTALPQEILQKEIARCLTHADVLKFNKVLKRGEWVYKKLPKDYAIKHQLRLSYNTYEAIAKPLSFSLGRVSDGGWEHIHVPKAVKLLKRYFSWFKDPKNHIVLMYINGRKEQFLQCIGEWTHLDVEFFEELDDSEVELLRDEAVDVFNLLSDIPFIRDVSMADHKSVFE